MTDITPPILTPVPLEGYPTVGFPITNITPFTYRDGWTFLEKAEAFRAYIRDYVVPWMQTSVNGLSDSWQSEAAALEAAVNASLAAQAVTVNNNEATLTTAVNNAVAEVIASSIVVQDPVIEGIINNSTSSSGAALRALFVQIANLDSSVSSHVSSVSDNTRVALDALYAPKDVTSADIVTINSELPKTAIGTGIDPTGVSDSTTALQAFIDAHPGTHIYLPDGFYKITSLNLSKGQTLVGMGQQDWRDRTSVFNSAGYAVNANFNGTVIRSTAITGAAITIVDTEVNSGGLNNLTLIGPGSGTSIGVVMGSDTETVTNGRLINVKVANFWIGVQTHLIGECVFDLMIRGCDTGIDLHKQSIQNSFLLLDIEWCGDGVIISADSVANAFYSLIAQSCSRTGLILGGIKNTFYTPYFENNTTRDITFVSGAVGNLIDAPFCNDASDSILIPSGASYNSITNFGGYGTAVAVTNAGESSHFQGNFRALADTGTNTILIDTGINGTIFGQSLNFAPTLSGITIGDGTITGKYSQYGKRVFFELAIALGSTSSITGPLSITTTFAPLHANSGMPVDVSYFHSGTGFYQGCGIINGSGLIVLGSVGTAGLFTDISSTSPFTWAAGDGITLRGSIEVV